MRLVNFVIFLTFFIGAGLANLLSESDELAFVSSINEIRSSVQPSANLKNLSLDTSLTNLSDTWTSQCSLSSSKKLKWLYSYLYFSSSSRFSAQEVVDIWNTESVAIDQFQAWELNDAKNWTNMVWENSTKIGCSMAQCGDIYFWGCLLSPKGGFPGLLPYQTTCVPSNAVDCEKMGLCGTYNDGCVDIVCGPTCGNGTDSGSSMRWTNRRHSHSSTSTSTSSSSQATSIDWRTGGYVTAIKNQGNCGGCWAHTATETAESYWAIKHKQLFTLSVQQTLDCSGAGSCNGGYPDRALAWPAMASMVTSTVLPYQGIDIACPKLAAGVVTGASSGSLYRISAGSAAMSAALASGPISISFTVETPFFSYSSGIYSTSCSTQINHAMVIVGEGVQGGTSYWIVRNSWGTGWGMAGYSFILKGSNLCNIETYPLSFISG